MIKKWDIILIAALLVLSLIPAGLFWLSDAESSGSTYAVVQVNGTVYKKILLTGHRGEETFTIVTDRGYNTVVVRDETIGITNADCPDQICVSEGFISRPGATTVCLPHKVLIEIRADDGEPDVIPAR